jgi:hypothetical protein
MPSKPPKRPHKMPPKRGNKSILAHLAPYEMPKPSGKYGYNVGDILLIMRDLSITPGKWVRAFGVNTVAIDDKGHYNYYPCDVHTALYKITKGKVGKDYGWD